MRPLRRRRRGRICEVLLFPPLRSQGFPILAAQPSLSFSQWGWQVPSRFRENWKALVVLTAVIAIFTNMVYSKDEPYFSQERDTHE